MRIHDVHDIVARTVIRKVPDIRYQAQDGQPVPKRLTLHFRAHPKTNSALYGTEIPHITFPNDIVFFCGRMYIPLSLYIEFLVKTQHLTDAEAAQWQITSLEGASLARAIQIQTYTNAADRTYPPQTMQAQRKRCMKDMLAAGEEAADVARRMAVTEYAVKSVDEATQYNSRTSRGTPMQARKVLPHSIRINERFPVVKAAIQLMRAKVNQAGIATEGEKFQITDVFPNRYSVHGNIGRENGDLWIPTVCPVIKTTLDWSSNKGLKAVRVWRKHNGKGMTPDNVAIMSQAAMILIEQSGYSHEKMDKFLDQDNYDAWNEWKQKYGEPVPKKGKV